MRIATLLSIALALACSKVITVGPLDGGTANQPSITAVDSAHPPKSMSVKLDQDAYVVVMLVAVGHSATLLYPPDSLTDNKKAAGTHDVSFTIPSRLVANDSSNANLNARNMRQFDSVARTRTRNRSTGLTLPPLLPTTPTFLLVISSPHPLTYARIIDKTAGVSIPIIETEALNAIGKAVKSTIAQEPRDYAGYFQKVLLVGER